jgi:methionyl-tRNA formyltransferase
MLAIANNRSHAYLDSLIEKELLPAHVILLNAESVTPGQKSSDLGDRFEKKLKQHTIDHSILNTIDVNAEQVIDRVKSLALKYMIYSGPGGAILGNNLLNCGPRFIHIHPGRLPDFRGSTTVYYHILKGNTCGATALFLNEEIDSGPILQTKEFALPDGTDCDLDYEYDPKIRAQLLGELIESYVKNNTFSCQNQDPKSGETFFIMHPVLRHIARLKLSA